MRKIYWVIGGALLVGLAVLAWSQLRPTLTEQRWNAPPVVVSLHESGGYPAYWGILPRFVLYADGRVIVSRHHKGGPQVQMGQLAPAEFCAVLRQIEAYGLLAFNADVYGDPATDDAKVTRLTVAAWRARTINVFALENAIDPARNSEPLAPALQAVADTYQYLNQYTPATLAPYQPERVALLVSPVASGTAAPLWPLRAPTLKALTANLENGRAGAVLEGPAAAAVYASLGNDRSQQFLEDGLVYRVTVRPLLPWEIWPVGDSQAGWGVPQFETAPTTPLTCPAEAARPHPTPTPTVEQRAPLQYLTALGQRNTPGQLHYASALVVNSQGEVMVADPGNDRLQWFSLAGDWLRTMPLTDTRLDDLALLPNGNWLLVDWRQNKVEIRSPNGTVLQTMKDWPPPEEGYQDPTDHIDRAAPGLDGVIYLAESRGNRVVVLNADGTLKEVWLGPAKYPLEDVMDIETDAAGNLYVVSDTQNRVLKRRPTGEVQEFVVEDPTQIAVLSDGSFYVARWDAVLYLDATGKVVWRRGQDDQHVEDLAVAPDGSVVVLYDSFEATTAPPLARYSQTGELLARFGTTALQPGQFATHATFAVSTVGDVWLVDNSANKLDDAMRPTRLVHLDAQGQHLNTFETLADQPLACNQYALAALPDQSVLVADPCVGEVFHLNATGAVLARWGQRGTEAGQFNFIADLALAADGQSVYILDSGNRRVMQFTRTGQWVAEWDSAQLGVVAPVALAVDARGTFFLLDAFTQQVVVAERATGPLRRWALPTLSEGVHRIAVDPARQRVYVGGAAGALYVFDWVGQYLGHFSGGGEYHERLVQVGPTGQVYLSTGNEEIRVYIPAE